MTLIVKIFADIPRLVGEKIIIHHIYLRHQRSNKVISNQS